MRLVPGDPERLGGYWLAGRLGAGGRGVVYDAYDDDGRRYAVKIPRGQVSGRPTLTAGLVSCPHLAGVVATGRTGAVTYMVSEFVEGPDLRQALAHHGPYAGEELGALAGALANALAALHGAGIAHHDLKPENVLLSPDGPRLIDCGMPGGRAGGCTHTYRAPETFTGRHPGETAADVFSWGAVVLYAATGCDPFPGETLGQMMHRLLTVDPDLSALPEPLRGLVGRALAKDPAGRPAARDLLPSFPDGPALCPPDGLRGPRSLGEVAEEVYASLTPRQQAELPGLLLRLLDGPGTHLTDGAGSLALLVEAGLLVRLSVPVEPVETEVGTLLVICGDRVSAASAALFRAWPRLRAWTAATDPVIGLTPQYVGHPGAG